VAAFRRGELRLESEVRWHQEFELEITALRSGAPTLPPADADRALRPGYAPTEDRAAPDGAQ